MTPPTIKRRKAKAVTAWAYSLTNGTYLIFRAFRCRAEARHHRMERTASGYETASSIVRISIPAPKGK